MPKCFCYNERKASLSLRTSAGEDICESTCSNHVTLSRAFLINASAPLDTPSHPPHGSWDTVHGGIVKIGELCGRKHCSSTFALIEWHNKKTLEFSVNWRCCSAFTCWPLHCSLRRKFVFFMFITSPQSVVQHYYSITPLSLLPYSANLINQITKDLLTKDLHRFSAPSGTTPAPCANKATSPSQISQRWEKVNQCWDFTSSVNEIDA